MCGIFGSTDSERFKTLYELNKDRGSFAYGGMYIHGEEVSEVQRSEGDSLQLEDKPGRQYYMGHTQGPTSAQREFDPDTSHPFKYLTWHVAHNGVLSNSKLLAEEYSVDSPVDSAIIPKMIFDEGRKIWDEHVLRYTIEENTLLAVCEKLKGTFSCWIHNTYTNNVYLIRCGSTLFAADREFSSAQTGDMEPLDDGGVYRLFYDADPHQSEWLRKVGEFKTSSPFFIL